MAISQLQNVLERSIKAQIEGLDGDLQYGISLYFDDINKLYNWYKK